MNPVRPSWYYTYVLKCEKTNTFYTGCTNNLKQRMEQHKKGEVYHTKHRLPVKLVYFEGCLNKSDAFRRERYLKTGMGKRYIKNRIKVGLTDGMNPVRPL
jgi:putative endonuclease